MHERLEKYFKEHLKQLKDRNYYNPHDESDRLVALYVFKITVVTIFSTEKDKLLNSNDCN